MNGDAIVHQEHFLADCTLRAAQRRAIRPNKRDWRKCVKLDGRRPGDCVEQFHLKHIASRKRSNSRAERRHDGVRRATVVRIRDRQCIVVDGRRGGVEALEVDVLPIGTIPRKLSNRAGWHVAARKVSASRTLDRVRSKANVKRRRAAICSAALFNSHGHAGRERGRRRIEGYHHCVSGAGIDAILPFAALDGGGNGRQLHRNERRARQKRDVAACDCRRAIGDGDGVEANPTGVCGRRNLRSGSRCGASFDL